MARQRSAQDPRQPHRAVRPAQLRTRVRSVDGAARAAATYRRRDARARDRDDAGGLATARRPPLRLAAGALAAPTACGPVTAKVAERAAAAHSLVGAVLAAARYLAVRAPRHNERVRAAGVRADAERVPRTTVLRPRHPALTR